MLVLDKNTTKHYHVVPDRQVIPGLILRHEYNTWRRSRTLSAESQALPTIGREQGGRLASEIEGGNLCPDKRIIRAKRNPCIRGVHYPVLSPACIGNQTWTVTAGAGFGQAGTISLCVFVTIRTQISRFAWAGLNAQSATGRLKDDRIRTEHQRPWRQSPCGSPAVQPAGLSTA